ncbi:MULTISPECIES: hypothetical protein [Acetobacterium]|uniref:hypothetical protein n=1 Tax=Acetobacterium TaxID=33951 RepID=UPI002033B0AD|nr:MULTISPECIES: hypothetical protein [Acetobacterium]URN85672.1 hypothetical protein CHL1_001340 [Acetobacterium wieringae]
MQITRDEVAEETRKNAQNANRISQPASVNPPDTQATVSHQLTKPRIILDEGDKY